MGRANPAIAAFNGGEFAPEMEGRVDVEKYNVGTHIQQNFIATKQGASVFRAGTAYVQPVKNVLQRTWLRHFEFSQTQAFQIEFGGNYCRFYTNHGPELVLATQVAAWSNATAYVPGNLVLSGGNCYLCTAASTNNAPPNASFWYVLTPYVNAQYSAGQAWIYEIPSPYASADLTDSLGEFALQFEQSGDVLYIAGGYAGNGPSGVGYPPYSLTRYSNVPPVWIFSQYSPPDGPFSPLLPIVTNQNVALGVAAVNGTGVGASVTVTAYGGNAFAVTDIGRLIRIGVQNFQVKQWQAGVAYIVGSLVSNNGCNYQCILAGTSGTIAPVQTTGTQSDGVCLWLYLDCNYGIVQITGFTNATTVTATVLLPLPAFVLAQSFPVTAITQATSAVITATGYANTAVGMSAFLVNVGGMTQINANMYTVTVSSGTTVTLGGINSAAWGAYTSGGQLLINATLIWQLGAWSNTTEWPRAVAIHKDRLSWLGRLNAWLSVSGAYSSQAADFAGLVTNDAAINILINATEAANGAWLLSAIILLVGTESGEYGIDAANFSTSPMGPDNVECLRQSQWRCRHIQPQLVGTSVLYVQRAGRKVLAMDYNFYLNRYDSTDQSKFSYHITIGGLVSHCYQQEPWSVLWGVRADGMLLSYTFNREDNVTGWCRHQLGGAGAVESVSSSPAPDGSRDEVWMIVRRTINGLTVRSVEYMAKQFEGPRAGYPGDAQSSAWYLDCAAQLVATPPPGATTTTITGLQYLIGETVGILADGGVQTQQVVPSSGTLVLQGAFTTVTVGLPYQGNLVPMRPEGGLDSGTAQGKLKDGTALIIRLVDSGGVQVAMLSNQNYATQQYQDPLGLTQLTPQYLEEVRLNDTQTPLNSPPYLMSGDFPVNIPTAQQTEQDQRDFFILVQQNRPLPATVVGLFPSYEVQDPLGQDQ